MKEGVARASVQMTSGAKLSISPSVGGALTLDFDSTYPDIYFSPVCINK